MVAEFANYESWIAWVPFVALLAIPLVLRRNLPLSLALAGSFVGMIFGTLVPPLGRDAEQFGPNLAVGLVGGAVARALLGLVIQATRTNAPRDGSSIVLGLAIVLGIVGAVIGGFWPSLVGGSPDLTIETLFSIAIGGGLGWVVGTLVGWRSARDAPEPDAVQRSLLVVAAIAIAMMGAVIVVTILGRQFGPSIDELTRHERHQLPTLAALYMVDTAIAVLTVLVLAGRGWHTTAATIPAAVPIS
jgi:hypothetical protein